MSTKLTFPHNRSVICGQVYAVLRKDELLEGAILPLEKWRIYKKGKVFLRTLHI